MKRLRFYLNQKGQTAVEYLLMTAVSVSLGVTFTRKVADILVDNPDSFIQAYISRYNNLLNARGGNRPYKRFSVQRVR